MADYARKRSGSADDGGDHCATITSYYGLETEGLTIMVCPKASVRTLAPSPLLKGV